VTGFAQSHEIIRFVATAFREWQDVVDLFGRHQVALLLALLAKGMQFDVSIADAFPASSVAFVGLRVSLILVVLFVHDLLMLGAVLLTFSEPTAAGVGAGTLGFIWHGYTSLSGHKKSPAGLLPQGSLRFYLPDYNDIRSGVCLSVSFCVYFTGSRNFAVIQCPGVELMNVAKVIAYIHRNLLPREEAEITLLQ
jgi:hypothetical protein